MPPRTHLALAELPTTHDASSDPSATETSGDSATVRRDTPLLPAPLPVAEHLRATVTILSGLDAGRLIPVDAGDVVIGSGADADVVVHETGVSRHHARLERKPDGTFQVEDLGSVNGTFVGETRVTVAPLAHGQLLQLGPRLRLRFAIVDAVNQALHQQLYDSSVLNPLTKVFNRRYLEARLRTEVARTRRASGELALMVIDVDGFKSINDVLGHLTGDRVLCAVAARIHRALRVEDVLVRFGGDEFVVLAVGTDQVDARQLAERLRSGVESMPMSARGRGVRVTASIGVASLAELDVNDEPLALLAAADARMYLAKQSGRNRVCTAEDVGRSSSAPPQSL